MKKTKRGIQICIFESVMLIIFFIYVQFFNAQIFIEHWQTNNTVFFVCFFTFILQMLAMYSEKIFKKTLFLRRNVQYSNEIFVGANFVNQKFYDYINKNNVSVGFLFIISLSVESSDSEKRFLISENANAFWKQFRDQFKFKGTFFFKTENNNFGVFTPINTQKLNLQEIYEGNELLCRNDTDAFREIEKINTAINNFDFTSVFEKKIKLQFILYGSIYGIHSNDISTLIETSESMTKSNDDAFKNSVVCYNPGKTYAIKSEFNNFLELKKIIDSKKIKIIFNTKSIANTKIYYPYYFYNGMLSSSSKNDILNLVSVELQETFLRHLSAKAIKHFAKIFPDKHSIIAFDFPLSSMYEKSSVSRIKNYLLANNIPFKNACVIIDVDQLTSINEKIEHSLIALVKLQIKFAFKNIDEQHFDLCVKLQPSFCFCKTKTDKSKPLFNEYLENLRKLYAYANIDVCDSI